MESQLPLTKKERKALHRQQQLEGRRRDNRKRTKRKVIRMSLVILSIAAVVGLFIWFAVQQPPVSEGDIIARKGLHWHPELTININGVRQSIPTNIGIGAVHKPIHTHDDTGVIHLEFGGRVIKNDIIVKKFFDAWGKQFNSSCILEHCNGPEGTVSMTVNGKENTEYEQYLMQDKDKIEIYYNKK